MWNWLSSFFLYCSLQFCRQCARAAPVPAHSSRHTEDSSRPFPDSSEPRCHRKPRQRLIGRRLKPFCSAALVHTGRGLEKPNANVCPVFSARDLYWYEYICMYVSKREGKFIYEAEHTRPAVLVPIISVFCLEQTFQLCFHCPRIIVDVQYRIKGMCVNELEGFRWPAFRFSVRRLFYEVRKLPLTKRPRGRFFSSAT